MAQIIALGRDTLGGDLINTWARTLTRNVGLILDCQERLSTILDGPDKARNFDLNQIKILGFRYSKKCKRF